MSCCICDKDFRPDDLAPLIRHVDGSKDFACRYCITKEIKEHRLHNDKPFWWRREHDA